MSEQTEMFGGVSTEESSEVARETAPPSAAPEAGILCAWCALNPSVTIMYGWHTCASCSTSTGARVQAYQQRLMRAAKEK